jgi:nucleotide-binding universal stress UspA family protein
MWMGYYSSLIKRKFKDLVGSKYDTVLKEYSEFLLTEEQMLAPEIHSILMPLDNFVRKVPPELYDVLSAFDAEVTLVYITDSQTIAAIEEILEKEAGQEYLRKNEEYGRRLLNEISGQLKAAGLSSHIRIFAGQKGEDIEKMAEKFDLLVLSETYGAERTERYPVSPIALKISQHVRIPTIIF